MYVKDFWFTFTFPLVENFSVMQLKSCFSLEYKINDIGEET